MGLQNEHHNSIRRYLLGELPEQELEQFEQLLMSDDDMYQELMFAEDDLIDDYISNMLSEEDRAKFKRRFLVVPELRQNVSFTSALRKHALKTAPQIVAEEVVSGRPSLFESLKNLFKQPVFAFSFAMVLLAAIALNTWLFRQNSQLKRTVQQLETQQARSGTVDLQEQLSSAHQRNQQLEAEVLRQQQLLAEESRKLQLAQAQQNGTTQDRSGVLALTLTSGFVRDSGEWTRVSLPPNKDEVMFRLDVAGGDYRSYRAVLQTIEGQPKWSKKDLKFRAGNFVPLKVPARILVPGDYRITLNGLNSSGSLTEISNYYFRVLK